MRPLELKPETEFLLKRVLEAMDIAQPMEDREYIRLMISISTEAIARIATMPPYAVSDVIGKKKVLTFEEFRKTGRNVRFADETSWATAPTPAGISNKYGRVYEGGCYIELADDGDWYLILESSEYKHESLMGMERRLYNDWYLLEHQ